MTADTAHTAPESAASSPNGTVGDSPPEATLESLSAQISELHGQVQALAADVAALREAASHFAQLAEQLRSDPSQLMRGMLGGGGK